MRKSFFITVVMVCLFLAQPFFAFSITFAGRGDFYSLELQPGSGSSGVILIGISDNERYLAYVEVYSPFQEFSEEYRVFAEFFIIDIPRNSYAIKPIPEQVIVQNSPMDQDCFNFFRYELLSDLMKRARPMLDKFDILPGVLPVRVLPYREEGADASKIQSFHLFNGEMGNLAAITLRILKQSQANLLDIRIRSQAAEEMEQVLQKDTKAPAWRASAKDYRIDRTYFYGNSKKYIVVFVEVVFEHDTEKEEKRYMCVTGEVSKIWDNAFNWSEDMFE